MNGDEESSESSVCKYRVSLSLGRVSKDRRTDIWGAKGGRSGGKREENIIKAEMETIISANYNKIREFKNAKNAKQDSKLKVKDSKEKIVE